MTGSEQLGTNDAALLRYLLGALPVDEAEPIEEATVIDEDFATRLNALERELVDSYVRGDLEGSNLAKFHSWYLSSPLRAQKVETARAILRMADATEEKVTINGAPQAMAAPAATAVAPVTTPPEAVTTSVAPKFSYGENSTPGRLSALRLGMLRGWSVVAFAAAVLILIAAVGFLSNRNKRLRNEIAETKKQSTELAAKLNEEHAAATASGQKGVASDSLSHGLDNVATVTMFLSAPTRGASTIPTITVPAGTGLVVLSLGLGSNDEKSYRAQLMDPTTQKVLWHSGVLRPGSDGTYVSVTVPANLLKSKTYLIQLVHDAATGSELLASYPFRAELK
jgi:hypothetical protein